VVFDISVDYVQVDSILKWHFGGVVDERDKYLCVGEG
jgi:hypothetical protein